MGIVRFLDPAGSVRRGTWKNDAVMFADRTYDLEEITVLPPADPSKIVCVGLNYEDHAEESGMEVPERPLLFLKPPNTLAAHDDTISLLPNKDEIEYEAELAVVIGKQCRNVNTENAYDVVEGFTCANDISNRDDQMVEQNWIRGKAFDNACPLGPVIVPAEDVPEDASIQLRHNGEVVQNSSRAEFIFTIPELIAEITAYMTLEAGDVILTGTPAGVGPLSDGDTTEVEIEGVGTLVNEFRAN
ncbi:fumarylacetoacetate hydrolase family protein [Haladaptatus salinisoli]|uniref:fumarylacetoacetate hydrolase family protein n=1 Tax=Haladaptatus salinisoli TaxID=2884876 RepID=UPI001D0AFDB5|nr:fumarylacetoacetate hydrolase family protein [Haladaptatus salinisoli]